MIYYSIVCGRKTAAVYYRRADALKNLKHFSSRCGVTIKNGYSVQRITIAEAHNIGQAVDVVGSVRYLQPGEFKL